MNESATISVILVVLAWAGSGLVTWGLMKGKMVDFERRLDSMEKDSKQFITRPEYDHRHADVVHQLDRIESKIDAMKM